MLLVIENLRAYLFDQIDGLSRDLNDYDSGSGYSGNPKSYIMGRLGMAKESLVLIDRICKEHNIDVKCLTDPQLARDTQAAKKRAYRSKLKEVNTTVIPISTISTIG
jgi:hypothetical protein